MTTSRRNLPSLVGTPRQIAWAEQIRTRLVQGLDRNIQSGQGLARTNGFLGTKEWLLSHTDASWWIDNRDKKPSTVNRTRYAEVISIYGSIFGARKDIPALRRRSF